MNRVCIARLFIREVLNLLKMYLANDYMEKFAEHTEDEVR